MPRYDAIAVYMMANKKNGTLYVGVTSNLIARIWQHKQSSCDGFTKKYGLNFLVWYELHATMESAIHRENRLKKYIREHKIRLIEAANPEWEDLYPKLIS